MYSEFETKKIFRRFIGYFFSFQFVNHFLMSLLSENICGSFFYKLTK